MKNNKLALAVIIAMILMLIVSCQGKTESGGLTLKKGVLMIGMEIGYPPMEYYDEDGKTPIGFDVEMGKAVAAKMGLTPEFVDTAWDGIFASLDTNKYDCIMSSVTLTSERALHYNFSTPYVVNAQYLVVRKDLSVKPKALEEVQGLRLTFQGETTSDELYQDWSGNTGIRLETYPYDKVMNCFEDLGLNRVDVILVDSVVAAEYLSRPGNPFEISALISEDEVLAVCIKKGNDELTAAINKALAELFAEGTLQRISQNIFGTDVVTPARQ